MAQGLQVFNSTGLEIFNSSNRTLKVVKTLQVVPNTTTVITSDVFLKDTPTYIITPLIVADFQHLITVNFAGNKATVNIGNLPSTFFTKSLIILGVY